MDLKAYYQKIHAQEAKIAEDYPVVVSVATGDGRKEGVPAEVTRAIAARMIVDGAARLATAEEAKAFRAAQAEAKRAAAEIAAVSRVKLAVLTKADLEKLKA
jgi:hypothetical protein